MAQSHNEIMSFMKKAISQEIAGLSGIGAFFRVGFWGGLPAELRGAFMLQHKLTHRKPLTLAYRKGYVCWCRL